MFAGYYKDLPSFKEIFALVRHYATLLPLSKYPDTVKVRDFALSVFSVMGWLSVFFRFLEVF